MVCLPLTSPVDGVLLVSCNWALYSSLQGLCLPRFRHLLALFLPVIPLQLSPRENSAHLSGPALSLSGF